MEIGEIIRDYKILSKLGSGGMGEVYLAELVTIGKHYAIKVLNRELTAQPSFIERFKQEAKILANLNHQNILSMNTFFIERGDYYMVLEYAPGITLAEYIKKKGRLAEDEALNIFNQLLEGVGFAHSRGVIHRDLKPSNIIFDEKTRQVKILDFGIAKIRGSAGLTTTGSAIGTVSYMSPEQIRSSAEINQCTDIYSLGLVLYEMLAGKLPYDVKEKCSFDIAEAIVKGEIPDIRKVNPVVSGNIAEVIRKITQKDAAFRPVTCFKVSELLDAKDKPGPAERITKKKYFLPVSVASAIVVVISVLLYYTLSNRNVQANGGRPEAGTPVTENSETSTKFNYYVKSGDEKYNKKDMRGAISDYTIAIEINPKSALAYTKRGCAKDDLKDYNGAIEDYTRAIEIDPKSALVYCSRGLAKARLTDYTGAIEDNTRAIEIEPKYTNAYIGRGLAKYALKDNTGAISDYTRAIELDSKYAIAYDCRGNAKSALKDYYGAIADYTRAIEINQSYSEAYYNRGLSKQKMNDLDGAVKDWKKAKELGHLDAEVKIKQYSK